MSKIFTENLSFLLVFTEGLLSFFSPCVIPLIPIYMSYLAGNAKDTLADGTLRYRRGLVFLHTLCFILGISAAFFLLGMSFTALGSFFRENQMLLTRIGGILIILLGLVQIGFLDISFLQKERKLPIKINTSKMNPVIAFLMGFTFSFAWTPCIGPALSSVLIMASGSKNSLLGNLLVLVYSAGFVIPFLGLGLFTTQVLNFLKSHGGVVKYTVKIGGILLILIGIMTFTGWMNSFSSYLNRFVPQNTQRSSENKEATKEQLSKDSEPSSASMTPSPTEAPKKEKNTSNTIPAFDFTLTDQYGNTHTLSDYKGKVVFLNFWATWCPPCRSEMPDIEELYQEYGYNEKDIIILGVANPVSDEYPNNSDVTKKEIIKFLEDNNYTFPVVFDETGDLLRDYYISAFPTTFFINKEGNIFGYVPGALSKDMMMNAIEQTIESTEK